MEIIEYNDHDALIPFYSRRGILELTSYPATPVFSYVIKEGDNLIAAATCSKNEGVYILEAIAVSEQYTNRKIGSKLLEVVMERLCKIGAEKVFINAKDTTFFEKNGFIEVDRSSVPSSEYSYCNGCEDYGVTCFPKIMGRNTK